MNYWCDCVESSEKSGKSISYKHLTSGQHHMTPVEIDKNECCIYCKHTAVYSKTDLTKNNRYIDVFEQKRKKVNLKGIREKNLLDLKRKLVGP